jgi:hypothetical protein
MPTRTMSDITAIEAVPLADRRLPENTYAALFASAARTPDAKALSFFSTASVYDRPRTWTYRDLVAEVTRAANVQAARSAATTVHSAWEHIMFGQIARTDHATQNAHWEKGGLAGRVRRPSTGRPSAHPGIPGSSVERRVPNSHGPFQSSTRQQAGTA